MNHHAYNITMHRLTDTHTPTKNKLSSLLQSHNNWCKQYKQLLVSYYYPVQMYVFDALIGDFFLLFIGQCSVHLAMC